MFIRLLSVVIAAQALSLSTAMAGIVVTVQDAVINPNGSGYVDIFISSTDGTDTLSEFSLTLDITGDASNGALKFGSDAVQLGLDPTLNSSYVFYNEATDGYFAYNDTDINGVDTGVKLFVSDAYSVDSGTLLPTGTVTLSTTPILLARIGLVHTTATPITALGDEFDLVVSGIASGDSYFADSSGVPYAVGDITATNGNITIAPEPSSIAIIGAVALFGIRRRSSRTKLVNSSSV